MVFNFSEGAKAGSYSVFVRVLLFGICPIFFRHWQFRVPVRMAAGMDTAYIVSCVKVGVIELRKNGELCTKCLGRNEKHNKNSSPHCNKTLEQSESIFLRYQPIK